MIGLETGSDSESEFIKKFKKELVDIGNYVENKYASPKEMDITDLLVMYCAFSKGASVLRLFLDKKGISPETMEGVDRIMYEWEHATKMFVNSS